MLFPTVEFAIFFPIVLAISWALMARPALWKPFILLASYVFYGAADPKFCFLLAGITVGNQIAAQMIAASDDDKRRQWICRIAVALDVLVLGVFKYYAFFVEDVGDVLDTFGLGMPLPLLTILLPIGVSFYTFQAITYVVDVKRRDAEPASLIDAAVYLSFFPHLVAGPIVRASEFLPQLKSPRDPSRVAVGAGIALIAPRADQEGRARGHARPRARRPGVRRPAGFRHPGPAARRLRVARPGLLRLLRLHGHRDRARAADGLRLPAELQQPASRASRSASSGGAGT